MAACAGAGLSKSGTKAALLQRYLAVLPAAELKAACKASLVPVSGTRAELTASLEKEMTSKAVRNAMSTSKVRSLVARGRLSQTKGGLKKKDLVKNKSGKFVTKKASAAGKKSTWIKAVAAARKALGVKGFAVVGGKSK